MLTRCKATTMLPVTDVPRAREFYEKKLGLTPKETLPNGEVIYETDGSSVAIYPRSTPPKSDHTELSFEVRDLEAEMRELRARGVRFEEYDLPGLRTEDGLCRMGTEKAAWMKDPDGNILCLHEVH
jgi:catechol 2,3-dioxygenase-like lactoylglutathione lyase family enzyme